MKKVFVRGQEVLVQDEEFRSIKEEWNEYVTASGVKVRIKLVVSKISLLFDTNGKPVIGPDGDQHVMIQSQNTVVSYGKAASGLEVQ